MNPRRKAEPARSGWRRCAKNIFSPECHCSTALLPPRALPAHGRCLAGAVAADSRRLPVPTAGLVAETEAVVSSRTLRQPFAWQARARLRQRLGLEGPLGASDDFMSDFVKDEDLDVDGAAAAGGAKGPAGGSAKAQSAQVGSPAPSLVRPTCST